MLWGVGAAWWTPRGPLTGGQAVWSVVLSLAVGALAGWVGRSRWAMLAAPVAFVTAVELARWGVSGPSVDFPHLSPFGFVALVSGRGVHGLLSVLPMVVGAAYGAGITRPAHSGRRGWLYARRAGVAALALAVALVTVAVALPGRTPAIPGRGSVAELATVGGLGLMIRGADRTAPVLLFVPGAPGAAEFGAVRRHLTGLERHFVVATLDRRGGGRSYDALEPAARSTLDGAVADTIAVSTYLRERFRKEKIYLLAHSGGSVIGVLAVQRRPDLYRAYAGTGQAVHLPALDRMTYEDLLVWGRDTGRRALVDQLVRQGPPPYPDFWSYEPLMVHGQEVYGGDAGFTDTIEAGEYTLLEKVHTLNAVMDTWSVLYPTMQRVDLRVDARELPVPVYFLQGADEMRGIEVLFDEWYPRLRAPAKHLTVVDGAGHRALFERPDRLVEVLTRMLAETR